MKLTLKDRTKFNAVLAAIHTRGYDVAAIQQQVRNTMATGHGPKIAYQRALNAFADANPTMATPLGKLVNLIEASDTATTVKYDRVLTQYIATGDERVLEEIAPMVRQDSLALAARNGEISAATAQAADTDWRHVGFGVSSEPQQFQFGKVEPQHGLSEPRPGRSFASQAGVTARPTGAQSRADRAERVTEGRPSPYAGMAPQQIREAMRADHAVQGWQRDAD